MSQQQLEQCKAKRTPLVKGFVLQRKCAWGKHADGAERGECRKIGGTLRRKQGNGKESAGVPPIVHEVLRSSGRSLDTETRSFMEPRFGRDFSEVRVHSDPRAAESAAMVNALAYTAGHEVVFASGRYSPRTGEGRRLLAHELAHVVQQSGTSRTPDARLELGRRDDPLERAAERIADGISVSAEGDAGRAGVLSNGAHSDPLIQRQPESGLDENALRIIALAQNSSRSLDVRGPEVVRAIIDQYYPSDSPKVSRIVFQDGEPGLSTTYTGTGASRVGIITVGRNFVENTSRPHFARRIAQVRHEIQHIEQHRAGMAGQGRSEEREFLAFYDEALFRELPHTGRITHSTRVSLIDAALGHYYCLSQQIQADYASRRSDLLTRRTMEARTSGHERELGQPPTGCARQSTAPTGPSGQPGQQSAAADGGQPSQTPRVSVQIPISPANFQFPFSGSTAPGSTHDNFLDQAYQPNIGIGVVHSWRRNAAGRGWDLGGFVQGGANLALGSSRPTTGPGDMGGSRTLTGLGVQGYVQPAYVIFSIDLGGDRSFQGAAFAQVGGGFLFSDIPGLQGWSISGQIGPQLSVDLVPNRLQLTGSANVAYSLNIPQRPVADTPSVSGAPSWGFNVGIQVVLPVSYHRRERTGSSGGR